MKTTKRKRSSKAELGVEAAAVAVTADADAAPVAVEAASESVAAPAPASERVVAETSSVDPVVVLAANCSVKDAAALKTSLCTLATQSTAVTLDVSAVERVDTATMQLLCAFVRDRGIRNQNVVWRGVSHALQDAARLLGVRALLGFDEAKGVAA